MKYDDSTWHSGGKFPEDSPVEYGGTHIALFLKWCFKKGWVGEHHLEHHADQVNQVVNDELTATDFLFKYCDGKFSDIDLSNEGNDFAKEDYGSNGLYFSEIGYYFEHLLYHKGEESYDFEVFSKILDVRYLSKVYTKP